MTPAWFTPRRRKAESRRPDVPAAAPVAAEASAVPECHREAARFSAPIGVEVWRVVWRETVTVDVSHVQRATRTEERCEDYDTEGEALARAAQVRPWGPMVYAMAVVL